MGVKEILEKADVDQAKAEWIKNISLGFCDEDVAPKGLPTTATGIKTFNKA